MTEHPAVSTLFLPATTTTDHETGHAAAAVLPVGAFEQHGPYLPLVTDALIATAIATAISQHHKIFQLPAITFGCSHEHSAFLGTVSLSPATLAAVGTDISISLVQQGINALMVVNGHGGNYVLGNVVQQANASVRCALGCIRAAKTGRRRAGPPASRAAATTTCTPRPLRGRLPRLAAQSPINSKGISAGDRRRRGDSRRRPPSAGSAAHPPRKAGKASYG